MKGGIFKLSKYDMVIIKGTLTKNVQKNLLRNILINIDKIKELRKWLREKVEK